MSVKKKTRAEVIEDGILPCGHAAEREDDNITIDRCFVCEWKTPYRAAADDLNDRAKERIAADQDLLDFVHDSPWTARYETAKILRLARRARRALDDEVAQRNLVNSIGLSNLYPY